MRVEKIMDIGRWDNFSHEWKNLTDKCKPGHPFLEWDWIRSWAQRLPVDDLRPLLIAISDDQGNIIALAPFQIKKRGSLRSIEGFAQEFCDYIDWLCDPALENEVGQIIHEWIVKSKRDFDQINIRNIYPDGFAYRTLNKYFPELVHQYGTAPQVSINGKYDEYLKTLKPKFLSDTRRRENKITKEVGEVKYVVVKDSDQIPIMIDRIAEWLSVRRENKDQTSYLDRRNMKEHFIRLYTKLNSLGMLHLSGLCLNDSFIAINVAFKYNNSLFSYTPVFEPEYSKYSVMRLLKMKHIEECYREKFDTYDFCLGGEAYKLNFNPTVKELYIFKAYGSSFNGFVIKLVDNVLKPQIKKRKSLKNMIDKILKWYKMHMIKL